MASSQWVVEYYRDEPGTRGPVEAFIDRLPIEDQAHIAWVVSLLEQHGPGSGRPYVRHVRKRRYLGELNSELSLSAKHSVGLLFCGKSGGTFVILHAYFKTTKQARRSAIGIALKRLENEDYCPKWNELEQRK